MPLEIVENPSPDLHFEKIPQNPRADWWLFFRNKATFVCFIQNTSIKESASPSILSSGNKAIPKAVFASL